MFRTAILLFALVSALSAREFDPRRDVFSFSNDTVLNYTCSSARCHLKMRTHRGADRTRAHSARTQGRKAGWRCETWAAVPSTRAALANSAHSFPLRCEPRQNH